MTSMPPSAPPPSLTPLGRGSVSLRIYPLDLPPRQIVTDIAVQARLAEEAGFDGCMFAEHHGGFPNYLPNPLLAAIWALEGTNRIWAAPCPLLLPLRPVTQIVEDLVWTHHRFPGRVGVGVGAGSFPVDFDMAGVPLDELFPRYRQALGVLTEALAGRASGSLAEDPGVAAIEGGEIPVVAGVQTIATTRRAARMGMGVLYNSLQTETAVREQNDAYVDAGGDGSRILIRRRPPASSTAGRRTTGSSPLPTASWPPSSSSRAWCDRAATHSTSECSWPGSHRPRCTSRSPATEPRRYPDSVNSWGGENPGDVP